MTKKLIKIPDNRIISMDEFRSILDLWREDRKDSPLRQAAKIVTEYDNPPQSLLHGVELRDAEQSPLRWLLTGGAKR